MSDDATPHLGEAHRCLNEAQEALAKHLAGTVPAVDGQISPLNQRVNDLHEQVDQLHQHQLSFHHGAVENTKRWTALADRGNIVEAVKEACVTHGLGLHDALILVKAYQARKYAFAQTAPNQA